jgi:juvenile hormone epoxide hydrolase
LIDPKDSDVNFELIVPSLPGYGFSERAHKAGLGPAQMAQIFLKLMKRLGHDKFYASGGDWGSVIVADMAALYPQNVVAMHSSICVSFHPRAPIRILLASIYPSLVIDEDEVKRLKPLSEHFCNILEESGYLHIQGSKPDTLGVGLSNSPSGLAAYILEKFSTWTNLKGRNENNGGLTPYYNLDDLLDNVMVYWITNSITSSTRLYSEFFNKKSIGLMANVPVKVPTGCVASAEEFWGNWQTKWTVQDKYPNIVHYTVEEKGGHFSAFEVPDLFAKDVVKFFNYVEKSGLANFNKK